MSELPSALPFPAPEGIDEAVSEHMELREAVRALQASNETLAREVLAFRQQGASMQSDVLRAVDAATLAVSKTTLIERKMHELQAGIETLLRRSANGHV